jgi:hypothetical protein
MKYCPECGKKSADAFARFCGSCGENMQSLGDGDSSATAPAAAPAIRQPERRPVAVSAPRGSTTPLYNQRGRGEDLGGGEINIEEFDVDSIVLTEDDFEISATDTRTEKMFFTGR